MNILFAVSEAAPFVKTGGLGDVAGSLPAALAAEGADVRVILPLYGRIAEKFRLKMNFEFFDYVSLAWRRQYCGLFSLKRDGVTWYFVDNEYYFKRDQLYGEYDDGERFAFFCRAVVDLIPRLGWTPDVIHCNDWQTALIPLYLRQEAGAPYENIKTVYTIHNIEYQGRFGSDILGDVFGLSSELYDSGILRYDGDVNLMSDVGLHPLALGAVCCRTDSSLCDAARALCQARGARFCEIKQAQFAAGGLRFAETRYPYLPENDSEKCAVLGMDGGLLIRRTERGGVGFALAVLEPQD